MKLSPLGMPRSQRQYAGRSGCVFSGRYTEAKKQNDRNVPAHSARQPRTARLRTNLSTGAAGSC